MSKPNRYRPPLVLSWQHAFVCALAMVLWAIPFYAQNMGGLGIGPGPRSDCHPNWGAPCGLQRVTIGDLPPLVKPEIADDEECLPWNLPRARDTTSSVATLKVPSQARRDYKKACNAYHKNKFQDAEQHLRGAIEKFQNYSTAWVMLGVVLDEQGRVQEARDACSQATKINERYLPAHLCAAEFSARNQQWEQLLKLADLSLGLNAVGDGYAYYFQAMAYLHLNNLVDAQRSALQAAEIDVNHNYLPLYFLLAQIYDSEGQKDSAATLLRQVLKHGPDRQQEDAVKQYLAKLDSEEATTVAQKSSENADAEASADRTNTSLALQTPNEKWIPEDIDHAVPPVASGVACPLSAVLDEAGRKIEDLVQNVDRFTATEVLTHRPIDRSGRMGPAITVKSNYLVSYTERKSGYLQVEEFRNGSLFFEFPAQVATIGTPSLVLVFHPRYIKSFRMECEGLSEWYGQPAWQVRFEQRADRPNHTLAFTLNKAMYDVKLKGRAWILKDSFQVARLETDLEESIPEIRLHRFHESVEYRRVESSLNKPQLWLPSNAELYMDFQGRRFYRAFSFTDFKIFSVSTQYQTSAPKETTALP